MRKKIKEATKCDKCGATTSFEQYENVCDQCGKAFPQKVQVLRMTMFYPSHNREARMSEFCSWECVKKYLLKNRKKFQNFAFIDLPHLVMAGYGPHETYSDKSDNFFGAFMQN